jgi:hypothetical protein
MASAHGPRGRVERSREGRAPGCPGGDRAHAPGRGVARGLPMVLTAMANARHVEGGVLVARARVRRTTTERGLTRRAPRRPCFRRLAVRGSTPSRGRGAGAQTILRRMKRIVANAGRSSGKLEAMFRDIVEHRSPGDRVAVLSLDPERVERHPLARLVRDLGIELEIRRPCVVPLGRPSRTATRYQTAIREAMRGWIVDDAKVARRVGKSLTVRSLFENAVEDSLSFAIWRRNDPGA